jgi:parvulin-like peptidyl-prolyl isomerase
VILIVPIGATIQIGDARSLMAYKRHAIILAALLVSGMILAACTTGLTPDTDPAGPDEISDVVDSSPVATMPLTEAGESSEEMPTAIPLWTPTAAPAPTQANHAATTDTDTTPSVDESLDPNTVAVVNGTVITREMYERHLAPAQAHLLTQPGMDARTVEGEEALRQLHEQVLDWLIDQALIEQAATREGISISNDEIEAAIAQMRGDDDARFASWLEASGLTIDSLREQVRMDLITAAIRDRITASLSRQTEQINVRHILLSQEEVARTVLAELRQGANFIATARQYSEDELTRDSGGEMGFIPRGVMSPAFEAAAFDLQPGEISDVVYTEWGLHIIQLVEIDPARSVPDEYWPVVQQRAFEDWLAEQREAASIRRNTP